MKLLLALLFLTLGLKAQKLPVNKKGRIAFSEVVDVPGISKKKLHERAVKILGTFFKPVAGSVIDESSGSVSFRGYAFYNIDKIGIELPYFFNYTLRVTFEQGKYGYTTTDFVDDENIPLEKGLLNAKVIYNEQGEVYPSAKETFDSIITGLKNVGEKFRAHMNDPLR